MNASLLKKYNVPAPRYTSYPTVPYWQKEKIATHSWETSVLKAFQENKEVSLYIHLPFCESLCTYCGCNKRITKNHLVEQPYIQAVLKEWQLYLNLLPEKPVVKEIHLGGGTPTFFSPEHLDGLMEGIFENVEIAEAFEFGFEAHPASTTLEHLETLKKHGFSRISIGIQDFDNDILKIINRHQSFEQVQQVTKWARDLGYDSINYDLIFGLPLQTPDHISATMQKIQILKPDRIAFYSYAHVPWIKPSQRAYSEADLPVGKEKRALYELGRYFLESIGYQEIGLDHFALKTDKLYQAMQDGSLHRNFMGYTPHYTRLSIALGASSISDSWGGFVQNEKSIEDYQQKVEQGEFPFYRGHLLTEEDQIIRQHILNIMCRFETTWSEEELSCTALYDSFERLEELEKDGLVERKPYHLKVTEKGIPFIRNICLALDAHYWREKPEGKLFSQVV